MEQSGYPGEGSVEPRQPSFYQVMWPNEPGDEVNDTAKLPNESSSSSTDDRRLPDRESLIYKKLVIPSPTSPMMTHEQFKTMVAETGCQLESHTFHTAISGGNSERDYHYQFADRAMEIRVLDLMPATSSLSDIVCRLRVVRMPDAPEYEALSYTWGDPSHQRFIQINGRPFAVTSNLWTALRHLRHGSEIRHLWVDAVCINQSDARERNFTVSAMHIIYHQAKRVIAWLGEATQKSEEAVEFLAKHLSDAGPYSKSRDSLLALIENVDPIGDIGLPTWEALVDLFGRAWWTRAWIVQEISCSRAWTLMCGKSQLDGNSMSCLLLRLEESVKRARLPNEVRKIFRGILCVPTMMILRQENLGFHLVRYRSQQAKDDKDKVYAFANMVAPPIPELHPDYEQSTAEIYYQTAVQLIQKEASLKLLSVCELHDKDDLESLARLDGFSRKFIPGVPTWVPNWAIPRIASELWGGYMTAEISMPFTASGIGVPNVEFHGRSLAESHGILTVRGKMIDRVAHIGPDHYGDSFDQVFQGILGVVRGKSIILLDEDDLTSVLFRTLTLDRDSSGKRIYKEIADDIDEVRRSAHSAMVGRIFFRTKEGFIGLGPRGLEVDNWVALIPGCHVPIILRKSAFLQGKIQIKCDHHEQVETCSSMGCAKTAALLHERFEVVGEACKYHSIKF
jgi:hypothetical protein